MAAARRTASRPSRASTRGRPLPPSAGEAALASRPETKGNSRLALESKNFFYGTPQFPNRQRGSPDSPPGLAGAAHSFALGLVSRRAFAEAAGSVALSRASELGLARARPGHPAHTSGLHPPGRSRAPRYLVGLVEFLQIRRRRRGWQRRGPRLGRGGKEGSGERGGWRAPGGARRALAAARRELSRRRGGLRRRGEGGASVPPSSPPPPPPRRGRRACRRGAPRRRRSSRPGRRQGRSRGSHRCQIGRHLASRA